MEECVCVCGRERVKFVCVSEGEGGFDKSTVRLVKLGTMTCEGGRERRMECASEGHRRRRVEGEGEARKRSVLPDGGVRKIRLYNRSKILSQQYIKRRAVQK